MVFLYVLFITMLFTEMYLLRCCYIKKIIIYMFINVNEDGQNRRMNVVFLLFMSTDILYGKQGL